MPQMTAPARLRGVAFAVIAAWLVGAPLYRQVLGGTWHYARYWGMYTAVGVDLAHVRYFQRDADGRRELLDRFAVLGHDRVDAPESLRRITADRVDAVGAALCERLGPGASVVAVSRVATVDGWLPHRRGDEELCAP